MANIINRQAMSGRFEPEMVRDLVDRVKGASILAQLSQQTPIPFNGMKEYTFNMDDEIDIVAEGGAKSRAGMSFKPVTIIPLKVEYGVRLTNEFMIASEEEQIGVMQRFNEGFAKKIAKGFDLMALHGVNPRTGSASDLIGTNNFDSKVTQIVNVTSATTSTADAQVEAAIALVQANEEDVTGAAFAPAFRSSLAALTYGNGEKMYPELAWGSAPGMINGLPVGVSSNVPAYPSVTEDEEAGTTTTVTDLAFVGNFRDYFRWGYAGEIPTKIIEYGDPDNSGRDLQGYNEIYMRAEMFIGWGILVPEAFARITNTTVEEG